jgi:hypothetical protein
MSEKFTPHFFYKQEKSNQPKIDLENLYKRVDLNQQLGTISTPEPNKK